METGNTIHETNAQTAADRLSEEYRTKVAVARYAIATSRGETLS